MSFKLHKEEKDHFIVTHPSGHFMKIAKAGISPDVEKQIRGFAGGGQANPKLEESHVNYAEGGKVSIADELKQEYGKDWNKKFAGDTIGSDFVGGNKESEAIATPPPLMEVSNQNMPVEPVAPVSAPQAPQAPQGLMAQKTQSNADLSQQSQNALTQYQKAAGQVGQAESTQAKEQAALKGQQIEQQKNFMDNLQEQHDEFNNEAQAQLEDFKNGKLDFNRVWRNKDTGQKTLSIIGLLLGGIGSGLTGQPNMAAQILDKEVERDIEQQKAEVSKKNTLYHMYLQKYGNDRDATIATMNAYNNLIGSQMEQVALQQKSPQALAQANMWKAEKAMQWGPQIQQMLMQRAALKSLPQYGGGAKGEAPEAANLATQVEGMKIGGLIDKDEHKQLTEEVKKYGENKALLSSMEAEFQHLASKNFAGQLSASDRKSAVKALAARVMTTESGSKRYNREEAEDTINGILPGYSFGLDLSKYGGPHLAIPLPESPATVQNKLTRLHELFGVEKYPGLEGRGLIAPTRTTATKRVK